MTETETAVATEAPPAFGETPQEAPQETPAAPTETTEAPEPVPAPRTWQTVQDEIDADEGLKSERDAYLDEVRAEARKSGHSEAQKRLQPIYEQYRQGATVAASGLRLISESLKEAIDNGADEKAIARALQADPNAWAAWNGLGHTQGTYDGAKKFVEMMADDDKLGKTYAERIDAILQGTDTAENVVGDLRDELVSQAVGRAKKPLEQKIAKLEAELETAKAVRRDGEGPSGAATAPSSAGNSGRPTAQQYAAATREQRDEWRKAGIEPLAQ